MQNLARPAGPPPLLWVMAAIFVGFELTFALAESGLFGRTDLRVEVYLRGAFLDFYFDRALAGESPPGWFWTSFVTYAFLHGGMLHLLMNTAVFLGLGSYIAHGIGLPRFLILFGVTAIAGAVAFGLIAKTNGPMIGASGVVFGFIGALKRWEWKYIQRTGAPANRFWGTIIALILINLLLLLYFPGDGGLAWEAHLGGFVAGFLIAPLLAPHAAGPSPI
ncbi:MAG: rhomboid family intramembrane serine protease [Pseudomonadota bacterium]